MSEQGNTQQQGIALEMDERMSRKLKAKAERDAAINTD
jgi:hypothetical protein